jgi:hypothetical protein
VDVREQVLLAANGLLTSCGTKLHPNLWQSLFDLLAAAAHGKSCVKSTSSSSGSGADSASEDLSKVDVASTSAATSNAETSPPLTSSETAELSTLVSKGGSLTPLETHRVRHLMAKSTPGSRDPNALPTGVESTKGSGVGGGGFKSAEEEMEWLMEKAKGAGTLSANEQARVMKAINTSFRDSRLFFAFFILCRHHRSVCISCFFLLLLLLHMCIACRCARSCCTRRAKKGRQEQLPRFTWVVKRLPHPLHHLGAAHVWHLRFGPSS